MQSLKRAASIILLSLFLSTQLTAQTTYELLESSEVKWEKLNPARGDKSPQAATLWGDRGGSVPTGFLVKFVDGFSSPPHIHNVSYRGIVIEGFIHNDDPDAAAMWMPACSFWTQPKGEVHITAAKGLTNIAFIEIDEAPYLVLPSEKSFDSGERPVNVDRSNLTWLKASDITGLTRNSEVEVAPLWGRFRGEELYGSLLKLPPGFRGNIHSQESILQSVLIKGQCIYARPGRSRYRTLDTGSYFGANGESTHRIKVENGCILYLKTKGRFKIEVD